MSVKSLEKHTVDGITVRVKRLGDHRIELISSDKKKGFQESLFDAVCAVRFTTETERTNRGNIACRLLPTARTSFNKLVESIVKLFVSCLKSYESMATESTDEQTDSPPPSRQRSRRYQKRHKQKYRNKAPQHAPLPSTT
ncbi:MAG TPA: hypothetical protein VHA05_03815 [Candidatus Saccharimonadales bacterium]|nr:hypothetical protein [Candidatus Saccharimonadales bacterium]